jgi:Dolichyl-phosphate-mannose-protein mannosyltransferase
MVRRLMSSSESALKPWKVRGRLPHWAGWRSPSWALYALAILVLAGILLRVAASFAVWPSPPDLADSWPYSYYAATDPLANPQHPPGYSLFIAALGLITHSVGAFVVLQHLLGIASALILFAGVRRLCGSPWPGVIGAGVILLGADQVYLEDLIMSETLFTLFLVSAIYAASRALERPRRWWPWPVMTAVLAVATGITRTSGLFLIPVLFLALLLARPRPWLPRWRPLTALAGVAFALLLVLATANSLDGNRFGVSPSPGWHLYARVAPIADCKQFTPPKGTEVLCERTAPADRFGIDWYLYDPQSPALRYFGPLGTDDSKLDAFARQVILHQPIAYFESVLPDIEAYFFPDSYGAWKSGRGTDIDGQLSWGRAEDAGEEQVSTQRGMETFFSPFSLTRRFRTITALYHYQRIVRVGASLLTLSTLLVFAGLFVGPRRNRIAILVLGVSGLAIIVLPVFGSNYVGRYMVPPSGPIVAAAAIALMSIVPRLRRAAANLTGA